MPNTIICHFWQTLDNLAQIYTFFSVKIKLTLYCNSEFIFLYLHQIILLLTVYKSEYFRFIMRYNAPTD